MSRPDCVEDIMSFFFHSSNGGVSSITKAKRYNNDVMTLINYINDLEEENDKFKNTNQTISKTELIKKFEEIDKIVISVLGFRGPTC